MYICITRHITSMCVAKHYAHRPIWGILGQWFVIKMCTWLFQFTHYYEAIYSSYFVNTASLFDLTKLCQDMPHHYSIAKKCPQYYFFDILIVAVNDTMCQNFLYTGILFKQWNPDLKALKALGRLENVRHLLYRWGLMSLYSVMLLNIIFMLENKYA